MGKTIKVLAEAELPPRAECLSTMLVDLCENVHIHCREIRQEFSVVEFFHYVGQLALMARKVGDYLDTHDHTEREVWTTIMKAGPVELPNANESEYWPHRLLVERIKPHDMGDIHLHWRDYRIQMTPEELTILAEALSRAVRELESS